MGTKRVPPGTWGSFASAANGEVAETNYARIYALYLPEDELVRYVGCTQAPIRRRLGKHWGRRYVKEQRERSSPLSVWLQSLSAPPSVCLLAKVPVQQALSVEKYFIYALANPALLNRIGNASNGLIFDRTMKEAVMLAQQYGKASPETDDGSINVVGIARFLRTQLLPDDLQRLIALLHD